MVGRIAHFHVEPFFRLKGFPSFPPPLLVYLEEFHRKIFVENFAVIIICIKGLVDGNNISVVLVTGRGHAERSSMFSCFFFLIFFFSENKQKNKRQSAYDGIRYDKLGSPGDINKASSTSPESTKLLIAADDVELNHDKLQQAFEEMQEDECENEDDENEETRFINSSRSSFYTSSERT